MMDNGWPSEYSEVSESKWPQVRVFNQYEHTRREAFNEWYQALSDNERDAVWQALVMLDITCENDECER